MSLAAVLPGVENVKIERRLKQEFDILLSHFLLYTYILHNIYTIYIYILFILKLGQKRKQYFIYIELVLLTVPDGFKDTSFLSALCLMCYVLQQLTAGSFFTKMNNYDPSASIFFCHPTLAFKCSEPSAATKPR